MDAIGKVESSDGDGFSALSLFPLLCLPRSNWRGRWFYLAAKSNLHHREDEGQEVFLPHTKVRCVAPLLLLSVRHRTTLSIVTDAEAGNHKDDKGKENVS